LTNLLLSGNSIKEITGFETLVNLRSLDIESNKLKKISGLKHCVLLETLNACKNEFDNLQNIMEISHNIKLRSLNIHSSQIAEIHPEDPDNLVMLLKSLPELRTIYL